jgi:hypothetical protein|tara:strand:- start:216 stop:407 length:192 start_codon:yes stop_codon:yes gene_type:complete
MKHSKYQDGNGLTDEDIKRIINSEVLDKQIKDKARNIYKEERKKEEDKIVDDFVKKNGGEGTI